MNNKDFTTELSRRMGLTIKSTNELMSSMVTGMIYHLQDGKSVAIHTFGTFEVKKKAERVTVNPTTKQRLLVPPKLVLAYRPSALLKDKFK